MTALVYYNRSRPISGCDCHNCSRWFNISNEELRIGTLLGLRNRLDQDDLDGCMIIHQGRPIQLMGMERVTAIVLLQLIPPQDYQFVDPWDVFVFVWGLDVFTDKDTNFFSGTEVLFDTAPVTKTQYKLTSLKNHNDSIILDLFDVKTGRKLSYSVTEPWWSERIGRLWRASVPLVYRPSLLHALTSPLDPVFDSNAVEYVQNVPWTVPRYDTWTALASLMANGRSHIDSLVEDLRDETDHMDANNMLFRLPEDVILNIVDWLEPEAQAVMRRVCKRFEKLIRRPVTVKLLEWK